MLTTHQTHKTLPAWKVEIIMENLESQSVPSDCHSEDSQAWRQSVDDRLSAELGCV